MFFFLKDRAWMTEHRGERADEKDNREEMQTVEMKEYIFACDLLNHKLNINTQEAHASSVWCSVKAEKRGSLPPLRDTMDAYDAGVNL